MPKPSPRTLSPVDVTVSAPAETDLDARVTRLPALPWIAAAVVGAVAVVLLGWVVVGAVFAVGWLTATDLAPAVVLDGVGQAWLGIHGVPFELASLHVGLTPLGLSLLLMVAMGAVGRFAVDQTEEDGRGALRVALWVAAVSTGSYAVAAWLVASIVGAPRQSVGVFVGALVIAGVGSTVGSLRAASLDLFDRLPAWVRGVPHGIAAGVGTLALASAATLAIGVGSHWSQISAVQGGLAPDAVGAALLVVVIVAYLPTLLLWAGAYALGSGLGVGTGTLVTPSISTLGLLPAVPLAGAIPSVPPQFGWALLISGPLAGIVSGAAFMRAVRPVRLGLVPGAVGAGAAGLAAALAWAAASWVARGDLGVGRLVGLGPRFPQLFAAVASLPVGAAVAAAVIGWIALRRQPRSTDERVEPPFGLAAPGVAVDDPVRTPFGLD